MGLAYVLTGVRLGRIDKWNDESLVILTKRKSCQLLDKKDLDVIRLNPNKKKGGT